MQNTNNTSTTHSGNYYIVGCARVVDKLNSMGIRVPNSALESPPSHIEGIPALEFTQIEHAMLDWFEDRDFDQAQALIHDHPSRQGAHVIRILNEATCPSEIGWDMICPGLTDAIAAIIYNCDRDTVVLNELRRDKDAVIAVIQGIDTLRIEKIVCEPFNITIRDRVRTAFKGVRKFDLRSILDRVSRLPGFANVAGPEVGQPHLRRFPDGCLLFGFPANWAFGMRSALQQVDISVTLSQAQELVAVFFGASSWHQLIKHRDKLNSATCPVAVCISEPYDRLLFFHTPEEALFAVGIAANELTEPLVMSIIELDLNNERLLVAIDTQHNNEETSTVEVYTRKHTIETGMNDYWSALDYTDHVYHDAALKLCSQLGSLRNCLPVTSVSTAGILYHGEGIEAHLLSLLEREGLDSDNLIFVGQYAFAVFYVSDPNGLEMLTAQVRIYRIEENGIKEINTIAMYKAEIEVKEAVGEKKLVIKSDYGRGDPIEIDFVDNDQVMRLLSLTHRSDLFMYSVPRLPTITEQHRH